MERTIKVINIMITVLLLIVVWYAVEQRFFEEQKCVKWAKERIFEVEQGALGMRYSCVLDCNSSIFNTTISTLANKSANEEWLPNGSRR